MNGLKLGRNFNFNFFTSFSTKNCVVSIVSQSTQEPPNKLYENITRSSILYNINLFSNLFNSTNAFDILIYRNFRCNIRCNIRCNVRSVSTSYIILNYYFHILQLFLSSYIMTNRKRFQGFDWKRVHKIN